MKILMIAPEPFFEPRGTPFSEYFRIQALCKMGHTVHLVTYPLGQDPAIEGLRIFRSLKLPFVKAVKTGPSIAKIFLDFFLFFKAWARLMRGKYDIIHTHEEACLMGAFLSKIHRTPHLYDMHSSLVQQMGNFRFTQSKMIVGLFKWIERVSLRSAKSVIVICRSLFDYAAGITEPDKLTMIENFIDQTPESLDAETLTDVRQEIGSGEKIILTYTGTLETYQGIPMLIEAMTFLDNGFRLVLIGGNDTQIQNIRDLAVSLNVAHRVLILGRKEAESIPYYLKASDILVSPRILGTNIPLKIYAYLKSGVPVVATDLYTHTQTLTPEIAILAKPEAEPFAAAIRDAAGEKGKIIGGQAAEFSRQNYSPERYRELVTEAINKAVKKNLSVEKKDKKNH